VSAKVQLEKEQSKAKLRAWKLREISRAKSRVLKRMGFEMGHVMVPDLALK
jgi:hypothetical protein